MSKRPDKDKEPLDPEELKAIAAELEALGVLMPPPTEPMGVARKLLIKHH